MFVEAVITVKKRLNFNEITIFKTTILRNKGNKATGLIMHMTKRLHPVALFSNAAVSHSSIAFYVPERTFQVLINNQDAQNNYQTNNRYGKTVNLRTRS